MASNAILGSLGTIGCSRDIDWLTTPCLVVNGEDFGRSHGINRGIFRAFENGILTSASLMVRWPAARQAGDYARRHPGLGVGLHFDLCEWVCRDGEWQKLYEVVPLTDATVVKSELMRQLTAFRELTGREPTHLDSHQHVHRGALWSSALIELAEELEIPVRHYSPGLAYCGDFYGQDSRGNSLPEYVSSDALLRIISELPPGVTELACHPGEDEEAGLAYGRERSWELAALCDPAARDAMVGTHLCSFAEVPYGLKTTTRLYSRAVALRESGQPQAAAEMLRRELGALPPAAAQAAAQIYLEVDEPAEAWRLVEPLSDGRIVRQGLLIQIARSLRKSGYLAAAKTAIERARLRDTTNPKISAVHDLISGECDVLLGQWKPPAIKAGNLSPVAGRVLHIVGKSLPHTQAGYTVRTQCVTDAQRRAGLDPQVVTHLGFPWVQGRPEASLCDRVGETLYHRLPALGGLPTSLAERLSANVVSLSSLVERLRPAVLHAASDYLNALLALAVGRAFGLPVVYEVRGFWEETWLSGQSLDARSRDAYQWRRNRELQCMLEVDHVVTLAEVMKRQLVDRGVPERKITVVPNAVNTNAFYPAARDETLAASLRLDPGEVVVGYISSFSAYEGIGYLIEAIAILRRRGLPVRGLLVGDGEERNRLEAMATELGVADYVAFTGRVPHADVVRHYSLIDIFVVPRTADRVSQLVTPLKPYEAMATGRAVVVSAVDALQEMVQEGVTGEFFEPENPIALADVLQHLVQHREERDRLGKAALAWVGEHRTWDRNGLLYRNVYELLCNSSQSQ